MVLCALAGAAAAAPASAAIAPPGPADEKPPPPPPPPAHLLLIHGGSFLFEDPNFQPATEAAAIAAGFIPHYVSYPLGNLSAAVLRARAEARRLRQKFGVERVYAYGASAGGTLAALLAGDGLVAAAAAKAPVTDLVGWEWPLLTYGLDYYDQIAAGTDTRYRLSPLRRAAQSPILVLQGRGDRVVPLDMNEIYAAKFPRVYLRVVPGGHATDKVRPWLVEETIRWLAQIAHREGVAAVRAEELPKGD